MPHQLVVSNLRSSLGLSDPASAAPADRSAAKKNLALPEYTSIRTTHEIRIGKKDSGCICLQHLRIIYCHCISRPIGDPAVCAPVQTSSHTVAPCGSKAARRFHQSSVEPKLLQSAGQGKAFGANASWSECRSTPSTVTERCLRQIGFCLEQTVSLVRECPLSSF